MPAKTTRVRLSAGQKLGLYSHRSQHPELSLRALAAWAGSAFKLRKNPSPAAVLMLLKDPVTEDDARSNPARNANQPVHCLPLEKALVRWIERCEQLKMPVVTWATIRAKAKKIGAGSCETLSTLPTPNSGRWCFRMGGSRSHKNGTI